MSNLKIPKDLKADWAQAQIDASKPYFRSKILPSKIIALIERIAREEAAIDVAVRYGGIDGDHHKAWVIDQMVRILAGSAYGEVVARAKAGEDGPETYEWDMGIAP
jgi:hypothetical protein